MGTHIYSFVLASLVATGCVVGTPDDVQDGLSPEEAVAVEDEGIPVDDSGNEATPSGEGDVDAGLIAAAYPAVTLASSVVSRDLVKDGSYIYFTTPTALKRVPTWGGTPKQMVGSLNNARGLAIDSSNLYWAEYGSSTSGCTIKKMPKIGGTITTLYRGPYGCVGVAINGTSVFWTNYATGHIGTINKGGTGLAVLAVGGRPREIAINGQYDLVWTNEGKGTIEAGFVHQDADLEYSTVLDYDEAPTHLRVSGGFAYWTNYDHGTVKKIETTGDADPVVLASGQAGPMGIDVSGGSVYWTNAISGAMMKANLDGTSRTKIATVTVGAAKLLVRYRASRTPPSLYWVNPSAKKVMKIDQY